VWSAAPPVPSAIARPRGAPGRPGKPGPQPTGPVVVRRAPPPPPVCGFSPRQTAWLLLRAPDTLTDEERASVGHLRRACPVVARLQALAGAFHVLVRRHDLAAFARRLDEAD
jgi:hypothetical protein